MKFLYTSICMILLWYTNTNAQYTKHVVQLKDKKGSPHTILNPSSYLTSKAVLRRSRQNIAVDSTDLPISPAYFDSIRKVPNVTILNVSKWLNQVLIQTSDANALSKINAFPFVRSSRAIAAVARPQDDEIINKRFRETVTPLPDRSLISRPNNQRQVLGIVGNTINYGNNARQIQIHEGEYLHNLGFTGQNITMAFLDAGYFGYKTNPAFDSVRLQNRILGEYDFVNNETSVNEDHIHGMYCLSIVASNRPGSMVGTAPHAKFWLFRTEDAATEYPVEEQNWAVAAEFADSAGADMISSSLGYAEFSDPSFNHLYPQRDGNTSLITIAADLAAKKGMIVMNSAGNSGGLANQYKYVSCPADGDSVVAVGATDMNGNIAAFSSWGPNGAGKLKPNIVSVGQGTIIANTAGNATAGNGTSFSNPNIAGLIACLWQAFPEFSNMQIIDEVQKSAHKYNNPDERFGYGIPNFRKAFYSLLNRSFSANITSSGCSTTINWTGKDTKAMKYEIERKIGSDTGFFKIATINGQSDSFRLNAYSFKDVLIAGSPNEQVSYRLRQYTTADTSVLLYSSTFLLTDICTLGDRLIVRPNPFQNNINLVLGTTRDVTRLSISLTDMKGRTLYQYQGSKSSGNLYLNIPSVSLPAGIYILTVRDSKKIMYTKKLVKQVL
ncbi:MAG: S8 family peptidase [Chitinophagaceae bacterium]|nr:S8 family peptidase [Chitinophagaceae bacterium]